jgi:release factor glutamine methyltransferase
MAELVSRHVATVAEAMALAQERLDAAGVDNPWEDGVSLLGQLLGLSRSAVMLERNRPLSLERWTLYLSQLGRRARREPLQHILGVAYFYGLELTVSPAVLVPRPETERLVELALEALTGVPQPRVVDVGTGSGAIALAIKAERPDAAVSASELSAEALEVARDNARRLGLEVDFVRSDLLGAPALQEAVRGADLLLSNPPYLPETDRAWLSPEVRADPAEALFSGEDGLAHFRSLEAQAFGLVKPGARMMLELDPRNSQKALAEAARWTERKLEADLLGRARFLVLER